MTYTTNIREAITAYYGDRCPDHDPNCVTCVAWQQLDQLQARVEQAEEALKYASMVVADVVETREVEPNTLMIARIKIEDVFPDFVDKTPPAQIHNKFTTQSEESGND